MKTTISIKKIINLISDQSEKVAGCTSAKEVRNVYENCMKSLFAEKSIWDYAVVSSGSAERVDIFFKRTEKGNFFNVPVIFR